MIKMRWTALISFVLAVSCINEVQASVSVISDDILEVEASGMDNYELSFTCNGEWSILGTESWISFPGNTSGKGDGKVLVNIDSNTQKEPRSAIVSVVTGSVKASMIVKQKAYSDMKIKHPSIAFTDAQFTKIKDAYAVCSASSSLKKAVNYVFAQADASYDVNSVTDAQYHEENVGSDIYNAALAPSRMAMNSAFAYKLTNDGAKRATYAKKAVSILSTWAEKSGKNSYFTGATTAPDGAESGGTGMYLARCMWPFFVTYDILKGTEFISKTQDEAIVAWFRNIEKTIKGCADTWERNDYFEKQEWNNWVCAHTWGLLSIGYALDDATLVQYAIDSRQNTRDFHELIAGCIFIQGDKPCIREKSGNGIVETGELYDRFRHDTAPLKGLQYTSLELQILSTMARSCYNNGVDMYSYTAPTGENLKLCYDYYADYYSTLNCSIHNNYYSGEEARISKAGDMQGLFELGYNAYPTGKSKTVIDAMGANRADTRTQVHSNLGILRLYSIDVDAVN